MLIYNKIAELDRNEINCAFGAICRCYCKTKITYAPIPIARSLERQIYKDQRECAKDCIKKGFDPSWCKAYLEL